MSRVRRRQPRGVYQDQVTRYTGGGVVDVDERDVGQLAVLQTADRFHGFLAAIGAMDRGILPVLPEVQQVDGCRGRLRSDLQLLGVGQGVDQARLT